MTLILDGSAGITNPGNETVTGNIVAGNLTVTGATVYTGPLTFSNLTLTTANIGTANITTANIGTITVPSGNITVVNGSIQSNGFYNENTTSPGVFIGNAGSPPTTPRIGFFNGNTTQNWQIDNQSGAFRWYTPGVLRMSLDPNAYMLNYAASGAAGRVPAYQFYILGTTVTLNSGVTTAQSVFGLTNGVALVANTTYEFELQFNLVTSGTTSHTENIGHTYSGTLANVGYQITRITNGAATASVVDGTFFTTPAGTATIMTGAITTAQNSTYLIKGILSTSTAGNFNPQVTFGTAGPTGTSTITIGSYMRVAAINAFTALTSTSIGSWT